MSGREDCRKDERGGKKKNVNTDTCEKKRKLTSMAFFASGSSGGVVSLGLAPCVLCERRRRRKIWIIIPLFFSEKKKK